MIVTLPVLLIAVLVATALGALLAWVAASRRATSCRNLHEAELCALRAELGSHVAESVRLAEQCKRLPELTEERDQARNHRTHLDTEIADLRQRLGSYQSSDENHQKRIARLEQELTGVRAKHEESLNEKLLVVSQLAAAEQALKAEQKQTGEKLALLEGARDQLSNQFKSLANEILEEKSKRFVEQNQANLGQLLNPLKTQLEQFRGRVDEVYVQESKDRSALTAQVQHLMALNQQLSADADNLTKALKGSSKTQGNWGELILDRILEASGLRKGLEYTVQESYSREDGSRGQPDVIVNLPEDKHLIVDSKVSLTAYAEYMCAETDAVRESCLARHIESVRSHIKGLSEKSYQTLYGLNSLDHVILFVPIESAFILATSSDTKLWEEAWRKNVLLVCPSTFLFVVRTVNHLWRQEHQNRNVQEIAQRGADLYDKFVGFVEDLSGVGQRLAQTKDCYEKAFSKLTNGRNNLVRQAEKLRDLGVRPTKRLPSTLVDIDASAANLENLLPGLEDTEELSLAAATEPQPCK